MKKIILLFSIALLSSTFTSCKKEKGGCIDSTATNYNSNANTSDNSCVYGEKLILWQSLSSAQSQLADGVTVIKWYVDDQYVGSHAAAEYSPYIPTCSSGAGQLIYTVSLGSFKTTTILLEAKDQNDFSLGTDLVTITAGSCSIYEF